MPPTDNPKTRSRSGPIAALVLFAVLVLYPVSSGPVYWMQQNEWLPDGVHKMYYPLWGLAERYRVVCVPLRWWQEVWIGPVHGGCP